MVKATERKANRRAKIKASKEQPIRIGDKIVRPSKRCTLTVSDADDLDGRAEARLK